MQAQKLAAVISPAKEVFRRFGVKLVGRKLLLPLFQSEVLCRHHKMHILLHHADRTCTIEDVCLIEGWVRVGNTPAQKVTNCRPGRRLTVAVKCCNLRAGITLQQEGNQVTPGTLKNTWLVAALLYSSPRTSNLHTNVRSLSVYTLFGD